MKYTKKDLGSYNLHMIQTDKFKTITVRILFRRPIKKEEVTMRNVLTKMLVRSTKKYNSKRLLNIEAQELYSADISIHNFRVGTHINTICSLNILNDKYTEKDNFIRGLAFLNEIVFNPDVENSKFNVTKLDKVLSNKRIELESIKENSSKYCLTRALEAFDKDSPCAIRMNGYIEDLDKINAKNLYQYYLDMLKSDLVDIFVIGDFDEETMFENIRQHFQLRVVKKISTSCSVAEKNARTRKLLAKETSENTQSKVNVICRYKGLSNYERDYVLPILSSILGGGTDSKLFKEVREENSLCYSISSYVNKLDHILIIQTGIDKKNYDQTIELIEKNIQDMKKGLFDEKDIQTAKQFYETSFDEIEETPEGILGVYMDIELLGVDELDVRRKKIQTVTKNEIIKVAKKIKIDTIFNLEGVGHEE